MPTFEVIIEETVSGTFRVEAADADEAAELAREGYRAGTLVLEPGECQGAQLCVEGGVWEEV